MTNPFHHSLDDNFRGRRVRVRSNDGRVLEGWVERVHHHDRHVVLRDAYDPVQDRDVGPAMVSHVDTMVVLEGEPDAKTRVVRVPVDDVEPAPWSVGEWAAEDNRRYIGQVRDRGFVGSYPVAREREDGRLQVIEGHKRLWVAKQAGLDSHPVEVVDVGDYEMARRFAADHFPASGDVGADGYYGDEQLREAIDRLLEDFGDDARDFPRVATNLDRLEEDDDVDAGADQGDVEAAVEAVDEGPDEGDPEDVEENTGEANPEAHDEDVQEDVDEETVYVVVSQNAATRSFHSTPDCGRLSIAKNVSEKPRDTVPNYDKCSVCFEDADGEDEKDEADDGNGDLPTFEDVERDRRETFEGRLTAYVESEIDGGELCRTSTRIGEDLDVDGRKIPGALKDLEDYDVEKGDPPEGAGGAEWIITPAGDDVQDERDDQDDAGEADSEEDDVETVTIASGHKYTYHRDPDCSSLSNAKNIYEKALADVAEGTEPCQLCCDDAPDVENEGAEGDSEVDDDDEETADTKYRVGDSLEDAPDADDATANGGDGSADEEDVDLPDDISAEGVREYIDAHERKPYLGILANQFGLSEGRARVILHDLDLYDDVMDASEPRGGGSSA